MNEQSQPNYILNPDFVLGNMATDLLAHTLKMCGKDETKTSRFPKQLYNSYVQNIVDTAIDIHEQLSVANIYKVGQQTRRECQMKAMADCIHLQALVKIAYDNKWISKKQHEFWQKFIKDVYWKTYYWKKNDAKK